MIVARLEALYRKHFREPRRERQFLATASFFVTFAIARLVAVAVRDEIGPFRGVVLAGTRVHHLVWGILVLLVVGYGWLLQVGTGMDRTSVKTSRLMAVLYGVGAALTLDEFALWLNLEDVYWEREGRVSIDVVLMFGALVSMGLWGGPFLRAVARQLGWLWGRRRRLEAAEHHDTPAA